MDPMREKAIVNEGLVDLFSGALSCSVEGAGSGSGGPSIVLSDCPEGRAVLDDRSRFPGKCSGNFLFLVLGVRREERQVYPPPRRTSSHFPGQA